MNNSICTVCKIGYYKIPSRQKNYVNGKWLPFCSIKCRKEYQNNTKYTSVICKYCNKTFNKKNKEMKNSINHFCSRSCSVSYHNTHKTKGTRRSKLELYLEEQLINLYPNLEIHFNRKDAINSELDIYIPSLKLAFELNGIFHYEPIYGQDKLEKIQNNDNRKFQACLEQKIELCIIDTSHHKYFKESTCRPFLEIICNILNTKYHVTTTLTGA